jgi:hypothetical protein
MQHVTYGSRSEDDIDTCVLMVAEFWEVGGEHIQKISADKTGY